MSDLGKRVYDLEQAVRVLFARLNVQDEFNTSSSQTHKAVYDCLEAIASKLDPPFRSGRVRLIPENISCCVCQDEGCEFCPAVDGPKCGEGNPEKTAEDFPPHLTGGS